MSPNIKEELNFYREFKEWYYQIIKEFGFEYEKDCQAKDLLTSIFTKKLRDKDWNLFHILAKFTNMIQNEEKIILYGCGPSLETTIEALNAYEKEKYWKNSVNLAADGAAVLLLQKNIPVHGLFTDLDGISEKEFHEGLFTIVHAHGDNMDKLNSFKSAILEKENVIGTSQVEPNEVILNPGGFTDGDRILYFLRSILLPHHVIYMIGMDFCEEVGRFSKPWMDDTAPAKPIKRKKLEYAIQLIDWLARKIKNPLLFVNSKSPSPSFRSISIEEFLQKL